METKYYSTEKTVIKFFNRMCLGIINIFLIVLFLTSAVPAQSTQLGWSNFSGGFGVSASGSTAAASSVGFSFTGEAKNGSSDILSGFLVDYSMIVTGIQDNELVTPSVYKLNQNYPNPFNPSTIINYQIPQEGFVTLKVYDILGNEISILVNEQKDQGNYKISFDAGKLASGVYIYQIKAGAFIDTKKMILLR